jgi:hypothetical protein
MHDFADDFWFTVGKTTDSPSDKDYQYNPSSSKGNLQPQ